MRSLVLRAGTVAGVVAVLALPAGASAAQAATRTSTSSSATTGRIVSGEALAASAAVTALPRSALRAPAGPVVHRRALAPVVTEAS